jgi:hypothetical protein
MRLSPSRWPIFASRRLGTNVGLSLPELYNHKKGIKPLAILKKKIVFQKGKKKPEEMRPVVHDAVVVVIVFVSRVDQRLFIKVVQERC